MTAAVLEQPALTSTGPRDDFHHWWCCDDNVALCGADLTNVPVTEQEEPICPACEVVRRTKTPCPVAGCGYGGGR